MADEYVTGLGKPRMQKVFRAIRFAFGIPDSSGSICLFVTIEQIGPAVLREIL